MSWFFDSLDFLVSADWVSKTFSALAWLTVTTATNRAAHLLLGLCKATPEDAELLLGFHITASDDCVQLLLGISAGTFRLRSGTSVNTVDPSQVDYRTAAERACLESTSPTSTSRPNRGACNVLRLPH